MGISEEDIAWVWGKADEIPGKDPNKFRRDELGNEIYRGGYGKGGKKSWEVDHRKPKAKGGTDNRRNLRALQVKANRKKGDD